MVKKIILLILLQKLPASYIVLYFLTVAFIKTGGFLEAGS